MSLFTEDIYEFAGRRVCIKSGSQEISAHLRAIYGRCLKDGSAKAPPPVTIEIKNGLPEGNAITINDGYYCYRITPHNGACRWTSTDLATGTQNYTGTSDLMHFVQTVVLRTVTLLIADHPLFHAGVVSWKNRGIIIPAHPDMGKTTLAVKLVMAGCGFLSDEIACFSPDLQMLKAFPRRLSLRDNSREILGLSSWPVSADVIRTGESEWMADIEDIVPGSHIESSRPHSIFFLQGLGDRPRIERVPRPQALLELMKFTYCPVEDLAGLLFKCAPLIHSLRCYSLISGNISETAKIVMEEVEQERAVNGD